MSDTPRTDALDNELHIPGVLTDRYADMRDHARQLETELTAAMKCVEASRKLVNEPWNSGSYLTGIIDALAEFDKLKGQAK